MLAARYFCRSNSGAPVCGLKALNIPIEENIELPVINQRRGKYGAAVGLLHAMDELLVLSAPARCRRSRRAESRKRPVLSREKPELTYSSPPSA